MYKAVKKIRALGVFSRNTETAATARGLSVGSTTACRFLSSPAVSNSRVVLGVNRKIKSSSYQS